MNIGPSLPKTNKRQILEAADLDVWLGKNSLVL